MSFFPFQAEDGIRDSSVTGVQTCAFLIQAEDGIRDSSVTGVQTCALPIFPCCRGFSLAKPNEYPSQTDHRSCRLGCRACIPLFCQAGQYVHGSEPGWVERRKETGRFGRFGHASWLLKTDTQQSHREGICSPARPGQRRKERGRSATIADTDAV